MYWVFHSDPGMYSQGIPGYTGFSHFEKRSIPGVDPELEPGTVVYRFCMESDVPCSGLGTGSVGSRYITLY